MSEVVEFKSFFKTVEGNEGNKCNYPTRLDTYGKGCSHDCNYCYAKSLLDFRNFWNPENPAVADIEKINKIRLANEIEKEFHGAPSGIDVTTIIENKMLFFKSIENYTEIINNTTDLFVAVLNTESRPCLTQDAIESVHAEKNHLLLKTIGEISDELKNAFQIADYSMIAKLLNENHKILQEIGCVTSRMQEAVEFLISNGAIAAKMTGAGFGGSVFGIFRFAENKICTHLKQHRVIISSLQNLSPVK